MAQKGLSCPRHPEEPLIEDYAAGDLICPKCGLVVGDRIVDVSSEWRTFASTDKETGVDRSRVGAAENDFYDDQDLSTNIQSGFQSADGSGKQVYANRKQMSSSDRHLMNLFSLLSQMCDRLNLTNAIQNTGKRIIKQVHESKKAQGRNTEAVVGACLYMACRQEQVPRTFKEICAVCQVSKKEIGRVFKLILKHVDTKLEVPLISSNDYLTRFTSLLQLPHAVSQIARQISQKISAQDLCRGRSPVSIAATVVVIAALAADENKNVTQVAETTGVAESTIRGVYKDLHTSLPNILPDGSNKTLLLSKFPATI